MNFQLENTIFCGQSFCWRKASNNNFEAVLNNKIYSVNQNSNLDDEFLMNYFDVDYDYKNTLESIKKMDPILEKAVDACGELHILNQDLWETTIGFILSQNNNIKRIEGLYDRLSKAYGTKIDESHYAFPRPEQLKGVTKQELHDLGVGFRDSYILAAVERSDDILSIKDLSDEKADKILQATKGIGPKVSACIRLFGLHNFEVFPKDVWIKKVMNTWFPDETEKKFAPYQGLAQQYLFHYARTYGF